MVIDMNEARLDTIEQIREFLAGTADVAISTPADQAVRQRFIVTVLKRHRYFQLSKGHRGVLFAYMQRLTGYTRTVQGNRPPRPAKPRRGASVFTAGLARIGYATSKSTRGFRAATMSRVRAAPEGARRPCSHSCSVRTDTPRRDANLA